jgi:hypothetical protein
MMKVILIVLLSVTLWLTAATAGDANNQTRPVKGDNIYALVVSGVNKDPNENAQKSKAVNDIRNYFLKDVKLKPEQLRILTADSLSANDSAKNSRAENLRRNFISLSQKIRPNDIFVFYYTGQANVVGDQLRLNLPGEDITLQKLAEWLKGPKASSALIVLDCPGAGLATKRITAPGRIVLCSCKAEQHYSTQFSRFFIPALTDPQSDTDYNSKVSVLEAFTNACEKLDNYYHSRQILKTETPVLEDDQDGTPSPQPWRYITEGKDGAFASKFFLFGNIRKDDND